MADGGAGRSRYELYGVRRQAAGFQAVVQDAAERLVGMRRFLAAAEDDAVAAFDAQSRRIDGHVGPRLVDEQNDSEGNADFLDLQAVGPYASLQHVADGVGQGRDFAETGGNSLQAFGRQPQAVDLRFG